MSMHFAPQWVKPIKPTGSALTPTTEAPPLAQHKVAPAAIPSSPFPALGQPRSGSPNHANNGSAQQNQPLSYSRVTHTPASPSYGGEGYFPYAGGDAQNGASDPSPYPFRYSREQILAVWDEDKFKERPIELMQIAENGAVIVSKDVTKPVGLRDLTELEKKLLSTSVHPPMPTRRPQQQHGQRDQNSDSQPRRNPITPKDGLSPVQTGRPGFGGFGRGEGGAFGGTKFSGALAEGGGGGHPGGRQPGAVGGGFAGVPKRQPRPPRVDTSEESSRSTWRQNRSAGSGGFEGVLGFGNQATTPASAHPDQQQGGGGGGGDPRQQDKHHQQQQSEDDRWSQKNWRRAPEADKFNENDSAHSSNELHQQEQQPRSAAPESHAPAQGAREDLGSVNWLYRDPNGQEQGPFTGNQMHEWYSHSYFQDDLPIRRQNETSFQTLAELKASTGNAVQPFLSPVRPRLPPNLPIASPALAAPGAPSPSLNDSFGRLHLHHPITPTSPFQQTATSPYYQPQFNAAPSFPQQQWNAAPGPRMNGIYGSIGPGAGQAYPGYGAVNPQPRAPDMFASAPIGQSPWGAPAPAAPAANSWQQPQPQQPQQMPIQHTPMSHMPAQDQQQQQQHQHQQQQQQQQQSAAPVQDSYFPEGEQHVPSTPGDLGGDSEAEADYVDDVLEASPEAPAEPEFEDQAEEYYDDEDDYEEEEEVHEVYQPSTSVPKQSAWATPAKPAASRESSTSGPTPAQATSSSKLPPAHSSLPPKPVAIAASEPEPVTPVKPSTPKPAPWAAKSNASAGPSLREIQEAESRQAEARKQALAEARALASPAAVHTASDDVAGTMSWGLPGQGLKANNTGSSTPPAPAWGGASDGPKKTLKQIQEEEEKRKAKAEAHIRAAVATQKRGYADLAAHAVPTPAQAAAAAAQGWTTVGAAGKITAAPTKPAVSSPAVAKAPVAAAKPAASPSVVVPKSIKANGADDGPSVEFIRWTKQALQGLSVPVDEFITMLLQFPVDPPASARADQLEIIADSVYASSATLDGRRFAHEFHTRRKQDAARAASGRPVQKVTSIADVVKTQPKAAAAEAGFKVVKKKGKKA